MILHYALNCFWLIVPILLMNLLLMRRLPPMYQPEIFSSRIPAWITAGENAFRAGTFALPLVMPLQILQPGQRAGLALYLAGAALYFLSWAMQIGFPRSAWSRSRMGFMAPSFTPAVWLAGIALIGDSLYLPVPWSPWVYAGLSGAFLVFHNLHTWVVYTGTQRPTR